MLVYRDGGCIRFEFQETNIHTSNHTHADGGNDLCDGRSDEASKSATAEPDAASVRNRREHDP